MLIRKIEIRGIYKEQGMYKQTAIDSGLRRRNRVVIFIVNSSHSSGSASNNSSSSSNALVIAFNHES